jgi:dTDP-4-dehydrorhamnose reductase
MKILVCGGEGQLGKELKKIANENYTFIDKNELDICIKSDLFKYFEDKQYDVIINCSAYNNVDKAEDEKFVAYETNAKAVQHLAEIAKQQNALLIHISTDYVFDGTGNKPYSEDDATTAINYYGFSKYTGEELIGIVDCNHIIIRTSWLYSDYNTNFYKTITNLSKDKDEIKVVVDQTGTPTYAGDLAQAIVSIVNKENFIIKETYHYSGEGVASWYDFAVAIKEFKSLSVNISPCRTDEFPSKVKRPGYSVLDKSKIKGDFGIDIPHWRTSLKKFIEHSQI